MLIPRRHFFFRTTWFPESPGRVPAPWKIHGSSISSTFPNNLHPAHVVGRGQFRRGKTGSLRFNKKLKIIGKESGESLPGRLILNPSFVVDSGKGTYWKRGERWIKAGLEIPAGLRERLSNPESLSKSDQKKLLREDILWQLSRPGKKKKKIIQLSADEGGRKKNLKLLEKMIRTHSHIAVVHPEIESSLTDLTWDDIGRSINAFEGIFGPPSRVGDHRQTLGNFKDRFRARFGTKSVRLSEVFDPASGLSFPYLERKPHSFTMDALERFSSLLKADAEEIHLSETKLKELARASGRVEPSEKIRNGFARMSPVSIRGVIHYHLIDLVNSPVVKPLYSPALLDSAIRRDFLREIDGENTFQIMQDLPSGLFDPLKGERILSRGIIIDHRQFRKGDIWWKDLWCRLSGKAFVLSEAPNGDEVKILFPQMVARELIELDAYRFLSVLSDNGGPSSLSWAWPRNPAKYFPRVRHGSVILSPRIWILRKCDLTETLRAESQSIPEAIFVCHGAEKFLVRRADRNSLRHIMRRLDSMSLHSEAPIRIEEAFDCADSGFREEIFLPVIRQTR